MAAVAISDLPAGVLLAVVQNSDGSWPNRYDTAHLHFWIRIVSGSSDPRSVTSPALNGAYPNEPVVGVL